MIKKELHLVHLGIVGHLLMADPIERWKALVELVNGRFHSGQLGIRDPENPCSEYNGRGYDGGGHCQSDGHYECTNCSHLSPEAPRFDTAAGRRERLRLFWARPRRGEKGFAPKEPRYEFPGSLRWIPMKVQLPPEPGRYDCWCWTDEAMYLNWDGGQWDHQSRKLSNPEYWTGAVTHWRRPVAPLRR